MIGITPAALIFSGRYWRTPPYCLLPVLLVADDALRILHRDLADGLHDGDGGDDDEEPDDEFHDEDKGTAHAVALELLADFGHEGVRETGHDTNHDDDGDTVADTAVGDPLAEPHHEHGTGHQDDGGNQVEHEGRPGNCACCCGDHTCNIGGALDGEDCYGKVAGDLVHLAAAALTLHLHLAEGRHEHAEKLNHDGCRDVRHHTQSEDTGITESTAGEHVKKPDEAFLGTSDTTLQNLRIEAREEDEATQTVNQHKQDSVTYPLAQFFDVVDVSNCLNKLLHCD